MKKLILLFVVLSLFLVAFQVPDDGYTWREVLEAVILIVIAALGAPFTQFLKNSLGIADKLALFLTMAVAAVFAVGEMYLSGTLDFSKITLETFPATFFGVFSVMTIYYQLLKESEGFFGQGKLLASRK